MKKIYILFTALFAIFLVGCSKDFFDVNSDPATPQTPNSKTLTMPLFAQMARGVQFDSRYLSHVVQFWGRNTSNYFAEIHGWLQGSDASGEIWRTNYFGLGLNLGLVIEDATKTQEYNFVGLAQALRAWSWQTTTDYHGDIILKQAFEPNRYVFEYDPQQDVYAEVVRLANESIANFKRTDGKGSAAAMAPSDLVYQGNNVKWIKFNYGLLARNANALINKANYNPKKVIEFADLALSSNDDNFIVPNDGSTTSNANFFGPLRNNIGTFRQTRLLVGLLNGSLSLLSDTIKDPRRNNMITASPDGIFRGTGPATGDPGTDALRNRIPNPWGITANNNAGAANTKYLFKDAAGFPIMTYSEIQFIKAEAAFRDNNLTLAYEAYRKGILGHIDFVSKLGPVISNANRDAYMLSASVRQSPATLTLADIMLQKFIAMWGHGFVETWVDLRKYNYNEGDSKGNNPYLGYFVFPNTFFADNGGKPAQRYRPRYNSEYIWNLEALKKVGGENSDYHTYKMWFSQP
jgi:hypothetical protein